MHVLFEKINRFEKYIFHTLVILHLLPVFINKYFLTLDGPVHLYNARILLDYFTGDKAFYTGFYTFNDGLFPNWFSHVFLAIMLSFCKAAVAEKMIITLYMLCFTYGFRALIKKIDPENTLISFFIFPFVYHYTAQMGFYNFILSLAMFAVYANFFIAWFHKTTGLKYLFLSTLFGTVLYFTHPLGYLLAFMSAMLMCVLKIVRTYKQDAYHKSHFKLEIKRMLLTVLSFLPSLILFVFFIQSRENLPAPPNTSSFQSLLNLLINVRAVVVWRFDELIFAKIISFSFLFLLLYAVFRKSIMLNFSVFDVFGALMVLFFGFYFTAPASFAGAGIVNERLMIIPMLLAILWFGTIKYHQTIKYIFGLAYIILSFMLIIIRLPSYKNASDAVEEYMTADAYIPEKSTVLTLDYCHNGKNIDGSLIAERVWIFTHAADYLGANKPLIMLANYEANTLHFPFLWKEEKNPFVFLSKNEGMEFQPPCVDIPGYTEKTGAPVDYVLLLNYTQDQESHPYTKDLLNQLHDSYDEIYASAHKRAILFKHNTL